MQVSGDLTIRNAPLLPGVATAVDVGNLARSFVIEEPGQGKSACLDRMPTTAERTMLQERNRELRTLLRPCEMAGTDQEKARQAIALMLAGFPILRNADKATMIESYWETFARGLPLVAVVHACNAVNANEIAGFDPDYGPPASPRLCATAKVVMHKLGAEQHRIDRILTASSVMRPLATPEQAERIKGGLRDLANKLNVSNENASAEERMRRFQAERSANNKSILAEYRALGLEPRYSGDGNLISPSLARQFDPSMNKRAS